ncbi:MAG TPA: 5-oxoprolinase subunit PxpA [Vicinamibacterales bacterium]
MPNTIDLNADVGESYGVYELGNDEALLRQVTSANVACGLHAGDPSVMRRTVKLAVALGVAVGAHPGFPDLQGFGRREISMATHEVEDLVLFQVAALAGIAAAEGVRLRHVKPHGALYNMAAKDARLASAIAAGVAAFDRSLVLVGPPNSALVGAAGAHGLKAVSEVFADRAYRADGSLVPRHVAGAVIDDPEVVVQRALRMARENEVIAIDGSKLSLKAETICVHGDTPGAAATAGRLRQGLLDAGITIVALR